MSRHDEVEDGMGFSGLAPSARERDKDRELHRELFKELDAEIKYLRSALAASRILVDELRERNAEAVQRLKDCVILLEITEKMRYPSWDKSATLSSVIGYARAAIESAAARPDPRDPDYSRPGIFATHNCHLCDDGKRPCINVSPRDCKYLHARND